MHTQGWCRLNSELHRRLVSCGLSDKGVVREENQDAFLLLPEAGVFVVADGMGGRRGGRLAADLAVRSVANLVLRGGRDDVCRLLKSALRQASRNINAQSKRSPKYRDMGSTAVVAALRQGRLFVAHVGDSRAYLLREGELSQLTEDHTLAQGLAGAGVIKPSQVATHPLRGRLTQWMGQAKPQPGTSDRELRPGDRILLSSDGLYNEVKEPGIVELLQPSSSPEASCRALVQTALDNGGRDNVTVVVIDYKEDSP